MSYDKNGNITNLQRNGKNGSSFGAIDNLSYTYSGNRLTSVTDGVSGNHEVDLVPRNGGAYTYYVDGSLKSDANEGIQNIVYDTFLKQPKEVYLTDGRKYYNFYDGSGKLLKTVYYSATNAVLETWEYVGQLVYKNGQPYQLATPEGRAIYTPPSGAGGLGAWNYEFNYQDHLGNTRVSFKAENGQLVKTAETAFDPWGVRLNGVGSVNGFQNRWEMQGHEKEMTFNLNRINFGNRVYNPTIGRFDRTDRYAEKYVGLSTYQYTANNPIKFIDVNGDSLLIQHGGENILYEDGKLFWAGSGRKEYDGKAMSKNGNLKGFVKKAKNALDKISSGEEGNEMIDEIQSYKGYVTLKEGDNQARGLRISWDSNKTDGGLNEGGQTSRPPFVGLAHELAHAHDYITDGTAADKTPWYIYPNNVTVWFAEVYATYYENKVRKENNIPLRKYYSQDRNEKLRLIDSNRNSIWFLNKSYKFNEK